MIPVPKSQVESVVGPIFESQGSQYEVREKEDVAHRLESLKACYEAKSAAAYVDDLSNPQACLVCGYHPSLVFAGIHVTAYLFWVAEPLRNTKRGFQMAKEMDKTLEDYGRMFNARSVMLSSWLFKSIGPNSQKLWPRFGYEPQELVMSKEIKY
jgi:hypothetical protein